MLDRLARERTLCAFDFDGTLAPIVDHPGDAEMRPCTRAALGRLASSFPCIVVSGRARADVLARLKGIPLARVIGNHGAETELPNGTDRCRVVQWKEALEAKIDALEGVWVEDKGLSLAIHYRHSARKGDARRRILAAAQKLEKVAILGGKQVINLIEAGAPDKGAALASERARLACDWVLFAGDDENDERAFALDGYIIGVRVGLKQKSHAPYYLHTQSEIDKLITTLADLRVSRLQPEI